MGAHTAALQPAHIDSDDDDDDGDDGSAPTTTSTATHTAADAAADTTCEVCFVAPRDGFALVPCGYASFCFVMCIITNYGQFVLFCVEFDMCKGLIDFIVWLLMLQVSVRQCPVRHCLVLQFQSTHWVSTPSGKVWTVSRDHPLRVAFSKEVHGVVICCSSQRVCIFVAYNVAACGRSGG